MANRERTKKKEGAAFPESGADSQAAISVSGADCTDTKAAISVSGADCTDTKAAISVAGADFTNTTTAIGHFSRWCGRGIRRLRKKQKSVVTRMSCRGRPAALLSPRGSSSGLFFLGPGRAPRGYSHTPNNTHNRPRCTLARARPARNDDQREGARQGRRPATEEKEKHHSARHPA